jgi:hypothetical protein
MPLSVYAPFRLCSFPFMPLSVYAPFRFGKLNYAKFLSVSFRLCPFPVWEIRNSAKFFSASFHLCPFPVWQILDCAKFLYASFLYASFRLCFFPFMLLSVYAPFRIDGNNRLCRIPLCQLPASPENKYKSLKLKANLKTSFCVIC